MGCLVFVDMFNRDYNIALANGPAFCYSSGWVVPNVISFLAQWVWERYEKCIMWQEWETTYIPVRRKYFTVDRIVKVTAGYFK